LTANVARFSQWVTLLTSPTNGEQMIYYYTIYFDISRQPMNPTFKTFSITFSKSNVPKDKWDHHDAVTDYLIDKNPNPFESIPHFLILKATTEQ